MAEAEHSHGPAQLLEPDYEEPPRAEGAPMWTAVFGNLMTLLLCFFVLLLSFATADPAKLKDAGSALAGGLRPRALLDMSERGPDGAPLEAPAELPSDPSQEEEMIEVVDRVIRERGLMDNVEAVLGESSVTIRVDGALMFQPGSDALKPEANAVFEEIAELAALFPFDLEVEGHTSGELASGGHFATNWELSTAQAVAAVRYLVEIGQVAPLRIHAAGFADTRPIADSAESREQNHRLQFVFYRKGTERPEPGTPAPAAPAH